MRITTQSLLLLLYVSCLSWLCCMATAESQPEDSFRWLKEDPDVSRNFTQIIQGYGYPVEEHQVTTTDGYVLTVFRIPQGRQETAPSNTKRPAVYLQHGLIDSSFTWIVNLPGQSLPYILADAGYDVWMGNNRGNRYSMKHIKYSVNSKEFWDFSFDEFAQYDVQNITNYILQQTGSQKLTYVGHSQGTTQMFAALSINPEFAQKLNLYIGLGPVGSIDYMQNTLLRLMGLLDVDKVIELFGIREFLITPKQIAKLFPAVCTLDPYLCDDVIEFLCGKHKGAFNNTRMPVVGAHEPGGTSVKDMSHWAQMLRERKFQKYDYGTKGNLQRYGTPEPPAYNIKCALANLTLPIGLVWGGKDELADPYDVKDLLSIIPNPVMSVFVDNYAHLDFCWALDAHERIYPQILQTIAKYAN